VKIIWGKKVITFPAPKYFVYKDLNPQLKRLASQKPVSASQNSDPAWLSQRPEPSGNPSNPADGAQSLPARQARVFPLSTCKSNG
jgi:hypothetical protein